MRRVALVFTLIISLLIPLLLCTGCGGKKTTGEVYRISDGKGDWGLPNPYQHYPRGPGYVRMSWVFDTLVWKDSDGYVPMLAKSWEYDEKKMAFTFELVKNAAWHDGKPVTARDIAFSIEYFKKHPYRWVNLSRVKVAEARGDHEVVIYLSKPYAPFISDVAGTMPIIPEHIWKGVKEPKKFTEKEAFIGSGPFKFVEFDRVKGTYIYEAHESYHRGKPLYKKLVYVKGNPMMNLTGGRADTASIKPKMKKKLASEGFHIIKDKYGWNKKMMINHKREPFSDTRFRRALAYALDLEEIVEKAHQGFGRPASPGLLSVDHPWYNPDTPEYPHNLEKARGLLEEMGYTKNDKGMYEKNGNPLKVELLVSNITVAGEKSPDRDGEIIRNQLEKAGIRVDMRAMEQAMTDSLVKQWKFDLALSGHGAIYGDAKILHEMITSKGGAGSVNSARYDANEKLVELLEKQMEEMDAGKRKELVFRIQEIYARDLPAISLYYPDNLSAYKKEKGVEWFYTRGGISKGIPIAQNKLSMIAR
jgi:peptide/nickel transport system substrate-binding protein